MITQVELKNLLRYDPETGVFYHLTDRKRAKKGSIAGTRHSQGYIQIRIGLGTAFLAHRLAWLYVYGHTPTEIDHINRNKTDNRLVNLRSVTRDENLRNTKVRSDNASGVKGVYYGRASWYAQITVKGKAKHLGSFASKEEASAARYEAERIYGYDTV